MTQIPVLLSAQGLSTDCSQPEKGRKLPMSKMDIEKVMDRLRAFGSLSSLQLRDSDASITLVRGDLRLTVTNVGGRLMAVDAHKFEGTPEEKSPEEIGAWLMAAPSAKGKPVRQAKEDAPRDFLSFAGEGKKLAFIGVMLVGMAVMGWINFGPQKVADDIVYIDHPIRIAGLNDLFGGQYGNLDDPTQVVFVVEDGSLNVHLINNGRMESEPLRQMTFRYASRGIEEVIVAENGAIIERDSSGNLVYSGIVYPKI